jgi:hypothetical protein
MGPWGTPRSSIALATGATLAIGSAAAWADDTARVLVADDPPFLPGTQGAFTPHRDQFHRPPQGSSHRPYHPAPGIVVDVLDGDGAVMAGLQRTARNLGYWPFRRCYEEGLRRNQALGGTVSLDLVVTPDAAARRTEVTSSTVRDDVVTACVAREAHHLALDPVEAPVTAKVRVLLALGDEPVAGTIPVPGAADLRAALRSSLPQATSCFEGSLARHPDGGGRIELRFEVNDDGTVAHVSEAAPHYPDSETAECIADVYRRAPLSVAHAVPGKAFVYAIHFEPRPGVLPVPLPPQDSREVSATRTPGP